jgi:integrase
MTLKARRQRRSHKGNPTPYLRADGRYALSIEAGRNPDGSRRRLPVYGRSAEEALENADRERARFADEESTIAAMPTLGDWCATWLERIHPRWTADGRREGIKHSSWRSYEMHVRLNIQPMLIGKARLPAVKSRMVREWLEWLRDRRGLSGRSRALAFTTLKQALQAAKVEGLIDSLPTDGVKGPKVTAYKARIFTLAQARQFLRAIRGDRWEALYLVAAFAGPRQGETLALLRDDIDFESGTVCFSHTLDWMRDAEGEPTVPVIEENKGATSHRTIRLPSYVMDCLRRHLAAEEHRRAEQGSGWTDFGLVFTRPRRHGGGDGYPLRAASVDRPFHRLLASNGLPRLRWHDMRHSAASIMLALGMSLHSVQKTLGWASLEMLSKRYGHLVPELAAEEMSKLQRLLIEEEAP